MVWVETTNEAYLVRSGYHLALSLVEMEAGTYLNNSQISKLWRHVWNIRGLMWCISSYGRLVKTCCQPKKTYTDGVFYQIHFVLSVG
jgi:hypothetical protein